MRTELVKTPLTESWALLKKEWKGIFWGLIKIDLLIIGAALAGIILAAAGGLLLSSVSPIAAIALVVLIAIPLIFVVQAISSIAYNFIDAIWSKKAISYSETFQENLVPVAGWTLVLFLIKLAVSIPFFALLFLAFLNSQSDYNGVVSTLAELLFRIFLSIALAIVDLFTQFAIFEIVISRSGVLGGFGRSFNLVKKNLSETVAFSFVLWVIGVAITVPFIILIFVLIFLGLFGLVIPGIGIVVLALIALIAIPLAMLMNALVTAVTITSQYRYWGKARLGR